MTPDDYEERDRMDAALIRLYRTTKDPRRLNRLVERFTPLVKSAVRPYLNRGEAFDDLVQVGMVGLVKALERFDPSYPQGFGAFARPTITGEIRRHFRDHTWSIHVPRGLQELQAKVSRAQADDPDATAAVVAERIGVPVEDVLEAELVARAYRANSLDMPAGDGESASLYDAVATDDRGYETIEGRAEIEDALSVLGPRDREIVEMRFFEERLQREIAGDMGVSQMQISRIISRSMNVMRDHLAADDDDLALQT